MTTPRTEVAVIVTRFIAGAGGVALRGALALDPERYRVTIVTGEGGPLLERAARAGLSTRLEPTLVGPISPRRDALALRRLTRLCRSHNFDVVHTHSAKAGALGRMAAYRAGTPVIVHTYHGFPFHNFQPMTVHRAYVTIERRLAGVTDAVLAVGNGVASEALMRGLAAPGTLRTIAPAVDSVTVPVTPDTRREARRRLGIGEDERVVGTVGRVDYQKAPEHLVEATALLQDRTAVVVWVGSGPGTAQAKELARERGLEERFRFVGHREDVAHLLPAFDVFAMASRYEGLPCAVVEAMRCGLPVVATAVNSVPDLVVAGESGVLVPPGRPRELARGIDALLAQPEYAQRLAARGRELADATFDADRLGAVLDDVYTQRLSASRLASVGAA